MKSNYTYLQNVYIHKSSSITREKRNTPITIIRGIDAAILLAFTQARLNKDRVLTETAGRKGERKKKNHEDNI